MALISPAIWLSPYKLFPSDEIGLLHVIDVPQLAYSGTGKTLDHDFLKGAEEAIRRGTNCRRLSLPGPAAHWED